MDEIKMLKKAVRDRIKLEEEQEQQRKESKQREIKFFLTELAKQVAKMPIGSVYKIESRFSKVEPGAYIQWSYSPELENLLKELGINASFSQISTREEGGWIAQVKIPHDFKTED